MARSKKGFASRQSEPTKPPSERYLNCVRRRGEQGALRRVGATSVDLRIWRRDPDFLARERAALSNDPIRPRVINLDAYVDPEGRAALVRDYIDQRGYDTDQYGRIIK
jgi:hypothetical protein